MSERIFLPSAIETDRLTLRPWRMEDADALYEAVDESRERVGRWLPWVQYYVAPAAASFFIQKSMNGWTTGEELPLGIFNRSTGRVLGGTGLHSTFTGQPIAWPWRIFETGYWLRDGEEGKGIMREAVRAIIRLVFGPFQAKKLAIRCDIRNAPSRQVAESLGFSLDLVARNDSRNHHGELRTTQFFSLLPDEATSLLSAYADERCDISWPEDTVGIVPRADHGGIEEPTGQPIPLPVTIETDRLILRPPAISDAPAWFASLERSRAELEPWLSFFRTLRTVQDVEAQCIQAITQWEEGTIFDLLAFEKSTGTLVGGGSLHDCEFDVPCMEIDWWLDCTQTGKGYATELGNAEIRFAFETWQLQRVYCWCQWNNTASRMVAERLGFHYEGTLRQEYIDADGNITDWAVYGLTSEDERLRMGEWPSTKITTG